MKNYFNFTKSQKVGVIVIACIILFQIVFLNLGKIRTIPNPIVLNDSIYIFNNDTQEFNKNKPTLNKSKPLIYHTFNPNEFNSNDWVEFGFSEKQAISIVNYKNKINGFNTKEDLKKVYVISDKKYLELEPYIDIPINKTKLVKSQYKKNTSSDNNNNKSTKKFEIIADLNTSNINELTKVVGVGEYTAKSIVKYRDKIGGFHSVNQLKEVYGVSDENIELIKQQVSIDKSKIKKINVNQMSIQQLKNHPYISWNVAQAIIEERLKGSLNNLQFLVDKNHLLTQKELINLLPYINY
jgi:competence ComEA-like helix-hairpin-helix protein